MNYRICFCIDRRMLAGLHVAVRSILCNWGASAPLAFHVFSEDFDDEDHKRLNDSLSSTGKKFELDFHKVDPNLFAGFPQLNSSLATYYRLVLPKILGSGRILYIDADTLCRTDLQPLFEIDLGDCPIGLAAEAPIFSSPDPGVAKLLGDKAAGNYYNAGVMTLDIDSWLAGDYTNRCLEFIAREQPQYHDQSALNYVLHGKIHQLEDTFNCRTNVRRFWPNLKSPGFGDGTLLHFVDFPKPWSRYGRWVHPFGKRWWQELDKTAIRRADVAFWEPTFPSPARRISYRKMLKDKLLFKLFNCGCKVKGVSE